MFVGTSSAAVIAYWNFNSPVPDNNPDTGTSLPAFGSGSAALVGTVTEGFTASNGSSDSAADNSNWRITGWPAQGVGNKSHGVRFMVGTSGYRRIRVGLDLRHSNTASKYVRLQYTTNGVNFFDHAVITMPAESWQNDQMISLETVPGADNNPAFGLRFVTEFQSTATGSGVAGYAPSAAGSTYGSGGTLRFDLVIISGDPLVPDPEQTVKVVNYNCWGADATNWTLATPQVQALGRQLAFLAPDVATLQEIPNVGLANMPAIIANYLPNYYLATNRTSDGDKGNMIVSRWPILRSQSRLGRVTLVPWGYNGVFTRDLFEAEIAVPGFNEPLHAFSLHLKAFNDPESGPRRAAEASAISNFFVTVFLPTKAERPHFIAGDFNEDIARPRSYEQGAMHRIINAATGLHLTTPRHPLTNDERTWSSQNPSPTIRFDYILPGQMLFTNIATNSIFRTDYLTPPPAGLQSNDSQVASDHLPVLTTFRNPFRAVPPPPGLLQASVTVSNQTATITWNSQAGKSYVVRGSLNLSNWFNVSPTMLATNNQSQWSGALVPGGMFFRVQELP